MSLPAQKLREAILLILYANDVSKETQDLRSMIMRELKISKNNAAEALARAHHVLTRLETLDAHIAREAQEYELERITFIERSILRLALYELLEEGLDIHIVVAEAIRLSKKFSSFESSKFIHAVIDAIYQRGKKEQSLETSAQPVT